MEHTAVQLTMEWVILLIGQWRWLLDVSKHSYVENFYSLFNMRKIM